MVSHPQSPNKNKSNTILPLRQTLRRSPHRRPARNHHHLPLLRRLGRQNLRPNHQHHPPEIRLHPAPAHRRSSSDYSLELSIEYGGMEVRLHHQQPRNSASENCPTNSSQSQTRPSARLRQHHRPQTRRANAPKRPHPRSSNHPSRLPPRRSKRPQRPRDRNRHRPRPTPSRRQSGLHRLDRHR
jgi:hypothetical protein